ncbi:MAG: integrase core domain-containing protein [Gemmataceae bacterium]
MVVFTRYLQTGFPSQNALDEKFYVTFQDECLNVKLFHHVDHARTLVNIFQKHYNRMFTLRTFENLE